MKVDFYKKTGENERSVQYPDFLRSEVSDQRIIDYIRYVRNASRDSIAHTKDRSEVSGGGKKPWRQKGTGRARHGSKRSPIWIGGGITFGPRNTRNFSIKMNKNERRNALLSIITDFIKNKKAIGISNFNPDKPKTSLASEVIEKLPIKGRFSLVTTNDNINTNKSFRNIAGCELVNVEKINIISLLSGDSLVFTDKSFEKFVEIFSDKVKNKIVGKNNE